MYKFKVETISSRMDAVCELESKDEYRKWFNSLVTTHLKLFPWPNLYTHRLLKSFHQDEKTPFAFLYYYSTPEGEKCELFGLYVDPEHRNRGIGSEMIHAAITDSITKKITNFNIRFISPAARTGQLVKNLKIYTLEHPSKPRISIYFPNPPYLEQL